MAIGYLHIFALPSATGGDSGAVEAPRYQFTFNQGGNTYSKVLNEEDLEVFLRDELGMRADLADEAMRGLHADGNIVIPNVKISDNDTAVMGLMEVGSDY
ncbi:MAG TPA: hypothetical protein VG897_11725 [Terriglobales bacterium]|nr:hypothetical protein [Terriglobales bacterium]